MSGNTTFYMALRQKTSKHRDNPIHSTHNVKQCRKINTHKTFGIKGGYRHLSRQETTSDMFADLTHVDRQVNIGVLQAY